MTTPVKRPHQQGEAFMVMRYEGPGGRREWIWNSRDAITPFTVESIDGKAELHHGNWHLDRYEPLYVPPIGSRIFVDLTEEVARPLARARVERLWDDAEFPMSSHPTFGPLGKEGAAEVFVREWVSAWGGHSPHCAVVTPALHEQFRARATLGRP
jgi:hypothetical protein